VTIGQSEDEAPTTVKRVYETYIRGAETGQVLP